MIVTNKVGIFPLSSEWRKLSDDILKSEKFLIGQENIDVKLFFKFHLKIMIKHLLRESNYARFLDGYEDEKGLPKNYNLYILK